MGKGLGLSGPPGYPSQLKRSTAPLLKTSDTVLEDLPGLAGFAIAADAWYAVRGVIFVLDLGGDFKFDLSFDNAPATSNVLYDGYNVDTVPRRPATEQQLAAQRLLGDRIRHRRSELGFSQEQLAHRCGVHRTFVGHLERGMVNPTLGTLILLATGLDVSVATLVEDL